MAERLSEEHELLAATYALGIVEGDERIEARRHHAEDGAFAAEVHAWHGRLASLYDEVAVAEPSPAVWRGVAAAIEAGSGRTGGSIVWWRAATGVATAVAAVLALLLVFRPVPSIVRTPILVEKPVVERGTARGVEPSSRRGPVTFAQLVDGNGEALLTARYEPGTARLLVATNILVPASRVSELWVIPKGGSPRSLGLIARAGDAELALAPEQSVLLRPGATLGVTLEDVTTAPHRAPSGKILASGPVARL